MKQNRHTLTLARRTYRQPSDLNHMKRDVYCQSASIQSASIEPEGDLALKDQTEALKPPSQYAVMMLNDDYTPMEFVVHILRSLFHMGEEQATQVMLTVHTQGEAVCGVYTKDVAETKAEQVNQYAEQNQHPLRCHIAMLDDD